MTRTVYGILIAAVRATNFYKSFYIVTESPMLRNHYFSGFLTASKYCGSGLKKDLIVVVVVLVLVVLVISLLSNLSAFDRFV